MPDGLMKPDKTYKRQANVANRILLILVGCIAGVLMLGFFEDDNHLPPVPEVKVRQTVTHLLPNLTVFCLKLVLVFVDNGYDRRKRRVFVRPHTCVSTLATDHRMDASSRLKVTVCGRPAHKNTTVPDIY